MTRAATAERVKYFDDNWPGQETEIDEIERFEWNDLNMPIKVTWSPENGLAVYFLMPRHGNLLVLFNKNASVITFKKVLENVLRYLGEKGLGYVQDGEERHWQLHSSYPWSTDGKIRAIKMRTDR